MKVITNGLNYIKIKVKYGDDNMKKNELEELGKYICSLNKNIKDIEDGRFYVNCCVPEHGSFCTFRVVDREKKEYDEKYFKWYVLKGKDGKYYPNDLLTWINNSIVERRKF